MKLTREVLPPTKSPSDGQIWTLDNIGGVVAILILLDTAFSLFYYYML